jgi:3-hydroxyisobutyrate dehydrogenase-like beta-hydroxyacid dehydrogenase
MSQVTVIGTGRMGSAMARRLASAGHHVQVWNRTPDKAEALAGIAGVRVAPTIGEAVSSADVILCSLSTGSATEAVLLDPECRAALRPEVIVCDMGTSGTATALALAEGLAPIRFVDSPVSGSVPAVDSGQLLVMASGAAETIAEIEPVMSAFAKRVIRVGDVGAGQSMKLSVNLIVHSLNSAVAEGLALAIRCGIAPEQAYEVFENSSIAAPYVLYKRAAFLDEPAPVAMSLDLVNKDLGLIADAARLAGLETPALDGVRTEVAHACEQGRGAEDMSAVLHQVLADLGPGPGRPRIEP